MANALEVTTTSHLVKRLGVLFATGFVALACDSTPTSPSAGDTMIVIGAEGLFPAEVRIKRFDQVTFTNNDTQPHSIVSDPVNVHTDCPPVNRVGLLNPGDSQTTRRPEL